MTRLDIHDGLHRRSVTVDAGPVRIGRDPDGEVVLAGDVTVSRAHAVLRRSAGGWLLTDLGSRNGTYLNGRRVAAPEFVGPNDRMMIGPFVLVLTDEDDRFVATAAATDGPTRARVETGLSAREIEVLRLVAAGDTDRDIADRLVISIKTVHSHLERIRDKTGCRRRPELIRFAIEHGLA